MEKIVKFLQYKIIRGWEVLYAYQFGKKQVMKLIFRFSI